MSSIEVKSFDNPDESNTSFNNAKMDIVKVGDQRVMRLVLQPGWKWSQDIKPTVGCLLYTSPSPRDEVLSRMPSSA